MNDRRTIVMLLLVLVASLVANCLLSKRSPSAGSVRNRPVLDPSFEVRSITIERTGKPRISIQHSDRWKFTAPFVSAAAEQPILRLADSFSVTPVEDVISDAELLKLGRTRDDFGFSDSQLTVRFSDGSRTNSLSFGEFTPSSNGVYVVKDGLDAVLVVPARLVASIPDKADAFRERDVFPYEPDFVAAIEIKRPGASIVSLTHEGEGWQLGGSTASSVRVREFLADVTDLDAVDFLWPTGDANENESISAAKLSAYGLDAETAISVVLRCLDGTDHRVLLGQDVEPNCTYALIHNGAAIVTIDASFKSILLQGERAFSDSRLFPVEESTVRTFSILADDISYVLTRSASGAWNLESPVKAAAADEVVSDVLGRLVSLTSADLAADGLQISIATNLIPCVVSAEAALGGRRLDDLRSKEILSLDPMLVRRLVLTYNGKSVPPPAAVTYSRERRMWDVEVGADEISERMADEDGIRRVLAALQSLNAVRIESIAARPTDLVRYGLETPYCSLAVDQEKEGSVRRNILIGAKAEDGGRYATVGSSEAVFVLSSKTLAELLSPLVEE